MAHELVVHEEPAQVGVIGEAEAVHVEAVALEPVGPAPQAGDAGQRLEAVLEAYAGIARQSHGHHDTELAAFLHRGQQVGRAEQQLRDMLRALLTEAAKTGKVRDDVAPDELTSYCLHALAAARTLPSKAAVRRLVTVTLAGMRPPR